jgi:short-subunit dehydrogenase
MKNPNFAFVIGASQRLGKVFAAALRARKQNVVLVARSKDKLESLASELKPSESVLRRGAGI